MTMAMHTATSLSSSHSDAIMKREFSLIILMIRLLSGCGGGTDSKSGTGRAEFKILWPERSRLIPDASNSIKVEIRRGGALVDSKVAPRPAAGSSSLIIFDNLPVAQVSAEAAAYPSVDGTGVAQAQGAVTFSILAGKTT